MNIQVLVLGLVLAAAWLVGNIFLIRMDKTNPKKAGRYVGTVFLFILCAGIFTGLQIGLPIAKDTVRQNTAKVDELINTNYGNIPLVRTGVDASAAPQAITELEAMVPRIITTELGISNILINSFVKTGTDKIFANFKSKVDLFVEHADENGRITASTIIKAIESEFIARIERTVFWINMILAAILAIFLCIRAVQAFKKPKE